MEALSFRIFEAFKVFHTSNNEVPTPANDNTDKVGAKSSQHYWLDYPPASANMWWVP